MLFWRCFVGVLLFLICLVVLGLADAVRAEPLQQDKRAELFFLCVDRLQLDIELGLKPSMSDQEALNTCAASTERIITALRAHNTGIEFSDGLEAISFDE